MLQRLTEDFEYANVLDAASKCKDPFERLAYVAAFTISSYSTTSTRTSKPFNPLLGETFECDRIQDRGWRAISEQVCGVISTIGVKQWSDFREVLLVPMASIFTQSKTFHYRYPTIRQLQPNIARVEIG